MPRIDIDWQALKLTKAVADGYADAARSIDEIIRDLIASRREVLPTIVWFCNPGDARKNRALEENVLGDEKVAIALKRFACLQGNIGNIPPGKLANDLRKSAPVFYLYDPAGKPLCKLERKSSASRIRFLGELKKLWVVSFKTRLNDFTRKMTSILDKRDAIEKKLALLEIKRARARGSASRLGQIARQKGKLEKAHAKLDADEKALLESVVLKDEFTAKASEPAEK